MTAGVAPEGFRIPPPDHHRNVTGGGWLRPALFGAMDGLVSNTSLIAGIAGGGASRHTILLGGLAGLAAGAFSMGAGEYTSVQAQTEATLAEIEMEALELRRRPTTERAELAKAYRERGLTAELADEVAAQLMAQPDQGLHAHAQEELGVDIDRLPNAWMAAGSSFVAFAIGALLPVLPYLLGARPLWLALVIGAVGLLAAGAFASHFTTRGPLYSGVRQLLFGALAAALTYGVGQAVGTSIG
jgi:VIT1/CCC1 family predicted Fe2+/Mn2+ transporter